MFRDSTDNWDNNSSEQEPEIEEEVVEQPVDTRAHKLSEIHRRSEMIRCYESIMTNGIFGENPEGAMAVVDEEMRAYAEERMEILVGLRQEKVQQSAVQSPFSETEIRALKMLASSALKRMPDEPVVVKPIPVPIPQTPAPIAKNPASSPVVAKKGALTEQIRAKAQEKNVPSVKKPLEKKKKMGKIGGIPKDAIPTPTTSAGITAAYTALADKTEREAMTDKGIGQMIAASLKK